MHTQSMPFPFEESMCIYTLYFYSKLLSYFNTLSYLVKEWLTQRLIYYLNTLTWKIMDPYTQPFIDPQHIINLGPKDDQNDNYSSYRLRCDLAQHLSGNSSIHISDIL